MEGVFCTNFASSRGPFQACRSAWCGGCYRPRGRISFHAAKRTDEDGCEHENELEADRFHKARNGDNLLCLFQCDKCVFRNTHCRDPTLAPTDELALSCIRGANLDSLWARTTNTVRNNLRWVKRGVECNRAAGQEGMHPMRGPMPLADVCGYGVATQTLLASLEPGSYHADHSQCDTVRKLRSAFSNMWLASKEGAGLSLSVGRDKKGNSVLLSSCPTDSEWFERFDAGLKKRMGQDVRPQLGFSIEVMLALVSRLKARWLELRDGEEKDDVLGAMVHATVSCVNAMRGAEGFLLDLGGVRKHLDRGRHHPKFPHCVAATLGQIKGEDGERHHLLLMVNETASGLEPRWVLETLVARREEQGVLGGPAFAKEDGSGVEPAVHESLIMGVLQDHQEWERTQEGEKLFEGADIPEVHGIFRSFKRGAIARAQEAGADTSDAEFVGRWSKVERAGDRRPGRSMREHCLEVVQLLDTRLRFSRAL